MVPIAAARRRINGLRISIQESGKLIVPLAGAGPFALVGRGAVAVLDATTCVAAALALSLLRLPTATREHGRRRAEAVAGFGHIRRTPAMRVVVLAAALAMFVSGAATAAQYSLVDALHRSPSFLGVLTALTGAGSIVAGLSSTRFITRIGEPCLPSSACSTAASVTRCARPAGYPQCCSAR